MGVDASWLRSKRVVSLETPSTYDLMTEDRESRILVVSTTLDQAKAVVKRTFCDLELHKHLSLVFDYCSHQTLR